MEKTDRKSLFLVLGLSLVVLIGGTRLPLFPNGDEVQHQDVALSISEGDGLRAPSYEGTGIDEFYAHYPPLYFYVQAGVLYLFGINPYSVRFVSFISFVLLNVLFLISFRNFRREGALGGYLVPLIPVLACTEITAFHLARWGRMDMFGNLLGVAGIYFLSRYNGDGKTRGLFISSICIGLSICTHFQFITYYIFLLSYLLIFELGKEEMRRSVLVATVPPALFVLGWGWAHWGRLLESVDQLLRISEFQGFTGLNVGTSLQYLYDFNAPRFLASGGPALFLILICWLAALMRYIFEVLYDKEGHVNNRKCITFGVLISFAFFVIAKYVLGINIKRSVTILYPSLIVLAISISGLPDFLSRWARNAIATVVSVQLLAIVLYVGSVTAEWEERAPEKRMWVKDAIPKESRVAGIPQYWYPFRSVGEEYRIIQMGFGLDRLYWSNNAHEVKEYDFLILREGHKFINEKIEDFGEVKNWERVDSTRVIGVKHVILKNPRAATPATKGCNEGGGNERR